MEASSEPAESSIAGVSTLGVNRKSTKAKRDLAGDHCHWLGPKKGSLGISSLRFAETWRVGG